MRRLRTWLWRLGGLFPRERRDRELAEELESHLQMHIEDNLRAGMTPVEARRKALIELGGLESVKEAYRDRRGVPWLEAILRDLRIGARMLWKNPGFTSVTVFTLALGIGASTAIFSVVNPLWFNPVPAAEPDRIVQIRLFDKKHNDYWGGDRGGSHVILQELHSHRDHFADLIRMTSSQLPWEDAGWLDHVIGFHVSPNFFSFWSVRPWLGRTFAPDEGRPGAPPVIVLSHAFWQNRLGGDPGWIGKPLRFGDQYRTLIGVMPPQFIFPAYGDFWLPEDDPLAEITAKDPAGYRCDDQFIAKLAPGVSLKQAQAMLDVVAQRHQEEHLKNGMNPFLLHLRPVREVFANAEMRTTIPGFVGAMIFILLIACANAANLNLARTEARQHELAIRGALGAGRFQLLRQLLLESLMLALAGAVAGLILACWSHGFMEWMLPPELPRLRSFGLDWQVLAYCLLIAGFSGLITGSFPAWYGATRPGRTTLKQSGAQLTPNVFRNSYRRSLVILEVSLALLLLTGAGLMIQSVLRLLQINLGLEPTNLLAVQIDVGYPKDRQAREAMKLLLAEIHQRFSAIPGVEAVGILNTRLGVGKFTINGQKEPVKLNWLNSGVTTADPFKAMRTPLLYGRYFDKQDLEPQATAVLVNETLAQRYWPGENAVGQTIQSTSEEDHRNFEVVGVVADVRWVWRAFLNEPVLPLFYWSQQAGLVENCTFFVRSRTKPDGLIKPLLAELKAAGPELRKPTVGLVKDLFYDCTRAHRIYMWYLAIFGAVGLLLACSGIYAVLAYSVSLRQREIGIRMALGATRPKVLRMVLRQGMTWVGIGLALGVVAACVLTRVLRGMLYGINPIDPPTFAAGALLLSLIALLACTLPARRAARIDPMESLRCE